MSINIANYQTPALRGGINDFCLKLNIHPSALFSTDKTVENATAKGLYCYFLKRSGYTYGEISTIVGWNSKKVSDMAKNSMRDIQSKKNPKLVEMYSKTKNFEVIKAIDCKRIYDKKVSRLKS